MGCAPSAVKEPTEEDSYHAALQPTPGPTEEPPDPPSAQVSTTNPGAKHLVWNLNGKIIDVVVGGEDVAGLEPDYQPPPLPPPDMEHARCQALRDLGLDYQSQEPTLDLITKLLGDLFSTPGAFIQLLDENYTYLKSASLQVLHKAPSDRNYSLASWLMLSLKPEMLVVEDLTVDKRFKANPFVRGPPFLRSCAMAPLLDVDGHRLGALGVSDIKPRQFTADNCALLCNFAEMAVKEIYRLSKEQKAKAQSLPPMLPTGLDFASQLGSSNECIGLLDLSLQKWPILLGNGSWGQITGWRPDVGVRNFWDLFQPVGSLDNSSESVWDQFSEAVKHRTSFDLDVVAIGGSKDEYLHFQLKPATSEQLDSNMAKVKIHAIGGEEAAEETMPDQDAPSPLYFATLKHTSAKSTLGSSKRNLKQYLAMTAGQTAEPVVPGVKLGVLLGKGSFGSVHRAQWMGHRAAVKIIKRTVTGGEGGGDDQQQEALIGLELQHPNIVRTFACGTQIRAQDFGEPAMRLASMNSPLLWSTTKDTSQCSGSSHGGSGALEASMTSMSCTARVMETWIVLELCNFGSLQEAIDRAEFKVAVPGSSSIGKARWIPDLPKILRTATEIASAMQYLHSKEVLHADLNPNNVLLNRPGGKSGQNDFNAKVSDFGMSRATHGGRSTIATETFGTVTHMPVELIVANRLSKVTDVYSFGIVLWELYTGERPWAGMRHAQVLARKIQDLPRSKLQWPPDSNDAIKAIAQQCMLSDPGKRPTFETVVERLTTLQTAVQSAALPAISAPNGMP